MKTEVAQGSRLRRVARRWHGVIVGAVLIFGHWRCSSYRLPPLAPGVAALPERLSQTGLYRDASCASLPSSCANTRQPTSCGATEPANGAG